MINKGTQREGERERERGEERGRQTALLLSISVSFALFLMIVFNYFCPLPDCPPAFLSLPPSSSSPSASPFFQWIERSRRFNRLSHSQLAAQRLLSVYACFINFHHTSSPVSMHHPSPPPLFPPCLCPFNFLFNFNFRRVNELPMIYLRYYSAPSLLLLFFFSSSPLPLRSFVRGRAKKSNKT